MRLLALKTRTGRMKYGEYFEASRQDARILLATGWATTLTPEELARVEAEKELDRLRFEYLALFGSEPDKRWGVDRVKEEIALVVAPPKPVPAAPKPAAKQKSEDEPKPKAKSKPKAKPKTGEYERRDMKARK